MASLTDVGIDPKVTAALADIYGQNGPQPPGFDPPGFLNDAMKSLAQYGAGLGRSRTTAPVPQPAPDYSPGLNAVGDFGANIDQTPFLGGVKKMVGGAVSDIGTVGASFIPGDPFGATTKQYMNDYGNVVGQPVQRYTTPATTAAAHLYENFKLGLPEMNAATPFATDLAKQGMNRTLGAAEGALRPRVTAYASSGAREAEVQAANAARQLEALRASGKSPEEIAAFQKTMAPDAATPRGMVRPGTDTNEFGMKYPLTEKGVTQAFHETSPDSALRILWEDSGSSGAVPSLTVATSRDLALGQGGKGAMLELDPAKIEAIYKPKKAGLALSEAQGGGTEYMLNGAAKDAITAITLPKDMKLTPMGRRLLNNLESRLINPTELPDGSVRYEVASTPAQTVRSGGDFPNLNSEDLRQLSLKAPESMQPQIQAEIDRRLAEKAGAGRAVDSVAARQTVDPGLLTRELQAAVGTPEVSVSQHPLFADYARGGVKAVGVTGRNHGGDIGTVTRAVMSGDEKVIQLLGDDLTNTIVQNKVADLVRRSGAPEDIVRRGLNALPSVERASAEPAAVVTVGRDAKVVDDTLESVVAPPKSLTPPVEAVPTRGKFDVLVDQMRAAGATEDEIAKYIGSNPPPAVGAPPVPPVPPVPPAPPSVGAPPPPPVARWNAGRIAGVLFDEVNSLWRGAWAGLDISVVALQGAPLILKELTSLPFYAVNRQFGGVTRPYIQTAFGKFFEAAFSGEANMNQITAGLKDQARRLGMSTERVGTRPADIRISDPLGGLSAREELSAGNIIQNIPGIGLLYRQTNFATITLLNALRVGEATNLQRAMVRMGLPFDAKRAGHLVNITTGYGDLPLANSANAQAVATTMQRVFFGPRLMTASVQNPIDTILSLRNVAGQAIRREPLNPIDIARIHTTASFVATGVGIMKLAEASGFQVGTDPEGTDFGRITLPGDHRIDFWGPFNEEARLVARELALVSNNVGSMAGLRPDAKPKYGARTAESLVADYITGKFGPLASAGLSVARGTNRSGQTPNEVIQSTIANPNPLTNPTSIVPVPFSAQSAGQAFDPAQGGQGGLQGVAESVLGAIGVSVLPKNQFINYDGFGRAEGKASYGQDAVFDEYMKFHPNVLLPAPNSTLGSGKTSFRLPASQREAYVGAIGNQRRIDLGNLIYSDAYQNVTKAQQEKMFANALSKADATANKKYLTDLIPNTTDPAAISAAAVTGFHAAGNAKDQAYWVATLDRAGRLTPAVKKAIDDSNVTLPGQKTAITADEYLQAAPRVHEYLSHVPFGTDSKPYGTPADWAAVQQANDKKNVMVDTLIRTVGMRPDIAEFTAKTEARKGLTGTALQIFNTGTLLENPERQRLGKQYGTMLTRFLGPNQQYTQE